MIGLVNVIPRDGQCAVAIRTSVNIRHIFAYGQLSRGRYGIYETGGGVLRQRTRERETSDVGIPLRPYSEALASGLQATRQLRLHAPRAHFGDAEKLRELFRRFGTRQLAEDHAALEFAINIKRGAVELTLGEMQLRKLRTPRRPTLNTDRRI